MIDVEPSIEITMDNSIVSIQSTTSTTTKAKRKAPARTKASKAKKTKTTRTAKQDTTPEHEHAPEAETLPVSKRKVDVEEISDSRSFIEKTAQTETFREEPSYPVLPQELPDENFEDAESEIAIEDARTPQQEDIEVGPPEKEHTPIPVKQISPIKEQSKPPRPTISPQQVESLPPKRRSSRKSKSQVHESPSSPGSSQESDVENVPPTVRPEASKPTPSSPGAPPPEWTPADVSTVFKFRKDIELFGGAIDGELSEEEKNMTVQEWIQHVAAQAEAGLNQESERIVGIFEREGQRALRALESIQCI